MKNICTLVLQPLPAEQVMLSSCIYFVLFLSSVFSAQTQWGNILKIPLGAPRLDAIGAELSAMKLEAIDDWWKNLEEPVKPLVTAALKDLLLQQPGVEFSDLMLIIYKRALRLASRALPQDEMFALITSLGPEGNVKWPEVFKSHLFLFMERQVSAELNINASSPSKFKGMERYLLNLPLFQVLPTKVMAEYLVQVPMEKRMDFFFEMSLTNLPLSTLIRMCRNAPERFKIAFRATKERWLQSAGISISPWMRIAHAQLMQTNPSILNNPVARYFSNFNFSVDYLFGLEFLRNPCPKKRLPRLNAILKRLAYSHSALGTLLDGFYHDSKVIRSQIHVEDNLRAKQAQLELQLKREVIHLESLYTRNVKQAEEKLAKFKEEMKERVELLNKEKVVCSIKKMPIGEYPSVDFLPALLEFLSLPMAMEGKHRFDSLLTTKNSFKLSEALVPTAEYVMARNTIFKTLDFLLQQTNDLASMEQSAVAESMSLIFQLIAQQLVEHEPFVNGKGYHERVEALMDRIAEEKPSIKMPANLSHLPSLESTITPSLLLSWLSDHAIQLESKMWWNTVSAKSQPIFYYAAVLYQALAKLPAQPELQSALLQVHISHVLSLVFHHAPHTRFQVMRHLLIDHGFKYFSVGKDSIVKIEPQSGNRYQASLYSAGVNREHLESRIAKGRKVEYAIVMKFVNVRMSDLRANHFFTSDHRDNALERAPIDRKAHNLWSARNLGGCRAMASLRLMMRDILGSHGGRSVRYDITCVLIKAFVDNHGQWIRYTPFLDNLLFVRHVVSQRAPLKLLGWLQRARTPEEFQSTLKVVSILRDSVIGGVEADAETVKSYWTKPREDIPLLPSDFESVPKFPLTKAIISFVALRKGFSLFFEGEASIDSSLFEVLRPLLNAEDPIHTLNYFLRNRNSDLHAIMDAQELKVALQSDNVNLENLPYRQPGKWIQTILLAGVNDGTLAPLAMRIILAYQEAIESGNQEMKHVRMSLFKCFLFLYIQHPAIKATLPADF